MAKKTSKKTSTKKTTVGKNLSSALGSATSAVGSLAGKSLSSQQKSALSGIGKSLGGISNTLGGLSAKEKKMGGSGSDFLNTSVDQIEAPQAPEQLPEQMPGAELATPLQDQTQAYQVQQGDTLSKIAESRGIDVSDIMKNNPQIKDPNVIQAGGSLNLPGNVLSPAQQGYNALKGTPVPTSGAQAQAMVAAATPKVDMQDQGSAVVDGLVTEDPTFASIEELYRDYYSPKKQKESLAQTYKSLVKESGLDEINTELINVQNVIDGTEEDIRNEVTKAGGFATDSQVMALTNSRNKQMIKNYNNLLETKNYLTEQVNTMLSLTAQDRAYADQQFNNRLNFEFQKMEYKDKMLNNTRSMFQKIADTEGYQGLYAAYASDPQQLKYIEKVMGFGTGGLQKLATLPPSAEEKLNLDIKRAQLYNVQLDNQKLIREANTISQGVSSDDLMAYASQYADTGTLPSPAELKLSGLNVGQVTSFAKQIPRPSGALVSTTTGTKSKSISPTQEDGVLALYDISRKTQELKELENKRVKGLTSATLGKVFGAKDQENYLALRQEIVDLLSRARTGAALTSSEEKFYADQLPGRVGQVGFGLIGANTQNRITNFEKKINGTLDTKLKGYGTAIYGYSKVKVDGVDRTVGEVVDIGGTQYKILPDGTLTDII